MNGLGGGAKTDFVPGRGKPLVRHCIRPHIVHVKSHKFCVLKYGLVLKSNIFNQMQLSYLLN